MTTTTLTNSEMTAFELDHAQLVSVENLDLVSDRDTLRLVSDVMLMKLLWPRSSAIVLAAWNRIHEADRVERTWVISDLEALVEQLTEQLDRITAERDALVSWAGIELEGSVLLGHAIKALTAMRTNARRIADLMLVTEVGA